MILSVAAVAIIREWARRAVAIAQGEGLGGSPWTAPTFLLTAFTTVALGGMGWGAVRTRINGARTRRIEDLAAQEKWKTELLTSIDRRFEDAETRNAERAATSAEQYERIDRKLDEHMRQFLAIARDLGRMENRPGGSV